MACCYSWRLFCWFMWQNLNRMLEIYSVSVRRTPMILWILCHERKRNSRSWRNDIIGAKYETSEWMQCIIILVYTTKLSYFIRLLCYNYKTSSISTLTMLNVSNYGCEVSGAERRSRESSPRSITTHHIAVLPVTCLWRQQGDDSDVSQTCDVTVVGSASSSRARSTAAAMSSSSSSSSPWGDVDVFMTSLDDVTAPPPPLSERKSTVSNRLPDVPACSRSTVAFRSNTALQQKNTTKFIISINSVVMSFLQTAGKSVLIRLAYTS